MDHKLQEIIIELSALSNFRSWIKLNTVKYDVIKKATLFLPIKSGLRQRMWHIIHKESELVVCSHCKVGTVTWNDSTHEYRKFCSNKCVHEGGDLLTKRKQTTMNHYGVDNYFKMTHRVAEDRFNVLGVKHALQSTQVQAKLKQTNLRKYGTEWNVSSTQSQDKKQQTCMERYGTTHAMTDSVREQISHTRVHHLHSGELYERAATWARYTGFNGDDWIDVYEKLHDPKWLLDQHMQGRSLTEIAKTLNVSQPLLTSRFKYFDLPVSSSNSTGENEVCSFLESLNVTVNRHVRSIIKPYELDIVLPDHGIAIEFNGIYWHSDSKGKTKDYHLMKTKMCNTQGIQLIHLRQDQWVLHQSVVKSRIRAKLGVSGSRIYGRSTTIVELSSKAANIFVDVNHLQRACKSHVRYGLMYGSELVACMTFGKSRFSNKYEYELLRYCSKIDSTVVGGASKLFKHFIRQIHPSSVVSYADRSWNTGAMYGQLSFSFSHYSPPNYMYFHNSDRLVLFSRMQFQKHKLKDRLQMFDVELTEWDNMVNNGYDRIWDCGNSVWVWNKKDNM